MRSPFPGMDPYLEQHWRDVHHNLITFAQGALNAHLPDDLIARVEERVFVEAAQGAVRSIYPDVRLVDLGRGSGAASGGIVSATNGDIAVAEPLLIHLEDEPASEGFIEIVEVGSGNRVITVIEILSAANKEAGDGQRLYLKKQHELKRGHVSLVEIDLLRSGQRILAAPPGKIPPTHRTTYQVCVRRGWEPDVCGVIAVPLRERLPVFKVPLRETDAALALDLQLLIDRCYENGRYHTINYNVPPNPPLEADDAAWAEELLRQAGKR